MKKLLTLITILFITVPAYAQETLNVNVKKEKSFGEQLNEAATARAAKAAAMSDAKRTTIVPLSVDFNDYTQSWNDTGVFIAQVETITAVENIESIVNTRGLDAVMIGPYDIAGSLGVPGETDHPKVREASVRVIEASAAAGISCMTQIADVNKAALQDAFDQGFTAIVMGSDLFILWKWAADMKTLMCEMR